MADRKARCFQLKVPPGTRLRDIKNTIEMQIDDNYITVFEEIGAHEHLVELARATHVHEFIEHGLDVDDLHLNFLHVCFQASQHKHARSVKYQPQTDSL